MNLTKTLTSALRKLNQDHERIRTQIMAVERAIAALNSSHAPAPRRRRRMSAKSRAAIGRAVKARWAAKRGKT